MRKLFLLHRNSDLTKSKSSIAELQRLGKLGSLKYLMIPILSTQSSYMAVAGDFLESFEFDAASIRYHMRLFATHRGPDNQMFETCIYDYATVTLTTYTIEEFYNAIHNIFANHFMRELNTCIDALERFFFIKISEIEITITKGKRVIDHYKVEDSDADDVPFDVDQSYQIVSGLANRFGVKNATNYMKLNDMAFFYISPKERKWEESREPIHLARNVSHVCIGHPFASTYTILKIRDYESALSMHSAMVFIIPVYINDHDIENAKKHPNYKMLPISTYYNIPKYEFNDSDESMMYQATERLFGSIMEIYPFLVYDADDIIGVIEYLPLIMKTYHEVIKVDIAESNEIDNLCGLELLSTVMVDVSITLSDAHPTEDNFHIATDVFQDNPPKIKDVCYLLYLREKSK